MSRVKFLEYKQSNFLNEIKRKHSLEWMDIVQICKVDPRTLFDWRRDKYQMSYNSFQLLKKRFKFSGPRIELIPDDWNIKNAATLGALRRNKLYGNFGTMEGRRRGGMVSVLKFRNDPELAKRVGFKLRKQIVYPKKSELLAEFIGIVLGDGNINDCQVRISTNSKTDRLHAYFIKKIVASLFKITSTSAIRVKNTIDVTISSKNLVDFLLKCGLKKGNKVLQRIDVPGWVFEDRKFIKGCLRGLIDTDGGIYFHNHITKGIRYKHMGLCFTSHSRPLLNSVYKMFLSFGINCKNDGKRHVSIYNRKGINKYFQIIGSHNSKHIERFKSYKGSKL